MQIIMGYKDLVDKKQQTPEKMYQLYMICWALELVRASTSKYLMKLKEKKRKMRRKWEKT